MKKFGDWLSEKLIELEMKPADLARATGMDSAVVSNLVNNKRQQPAVESCKLIAKALNIPLEEVYRAADILPPKPNADAITDAVINLMQNLERADKEDILEYARLRHKLAAERSNVKTDTKRATKRIAPT
jgi:transcriptional regulator with XRE-family HTH domain